MRACFICGADYACRHREGLLLVEDAPRHRAPNGDLPPAKRPSSVRPIKDRVRTRRGKAMTADERRQVYLLEAGKLEQYRREYPQPC